jgi:hypothetical protein|tara:strand:- start:900 stop:1283 length:384 start_codon:yes stop_codon:yes gene_type:complete
MKTKQRLVNARKSDPLMLTKDGREIYIICSDYDPTGWRRNFYWGAVAKAEVPMKEKEVEKEDILGETYTETVMEYDGTYEESKKIFETIQMDDCADYVKGEAFKLGSLGIGKVTSSANSINMITKVK